MDGADKHFIKMALNLSFTHKACIDHIIAGQFMYITKEAIWLANSRIFCSYSHF